MKSQKKTIRIALSGDRGRMGKSLSRLIKEKPFMQVTAGANKTRAPESWPTGQIDGVIDFSLPELFSQSLDWAFQHKKAFVSGTTGLSSSQKNSLKSAGKKIPVFYSENMSGGIFLLSRWLKDIFYEEFKVRIEDIHHKDKKDKPSGTALRLKESLPRFLKNKAKIQSLRQAQEFGTHRVFLQSAEEILILEHQALNRELFAKGALQALLFILKKKKGFYSLSDLYQQKKALPFF